MSVGSGHLRGASSDRFEPNPNLTPSVGPGRSSPNPTPSTGCGRFAPSPSGDLHVGNLRTAILAYVFARSSGRRFIMRVEDVDTQRSSQESARRQLEDLASIGLEWDATFEQSSRNARYEEALRSLPTYECYCSRREIQEAARAPHALPGEYPGTCRDLGEQARRERRQALASANRVPAIRLRADVCSWVVEDYFAGRVEGRVDDMVLRRGGASPDWAYNLAVVVDDADQGVDQVVRGDDLLEMAPRQAYLAHLLGASGPTYAHVPLVVNAEGCRLAKRDGAVTLREMRREGMTIAQVVERLGASIGVPGARSVSEICERFDPSAMPREPFVWPGFEDWRADANSACPAP